MNVQRFTKPIRMGLSGLLIGCLLAMAIIAVASPVNAVVGLVVTRDLPPTVEPGELFEVTVTFTAQHDEFTCGVDDFAPTVPSNWIVTADAAWSTPAGGTVVDYGNNQFAILWMAEFDAGTEFTVVYKVTVPVAATPGTYNFTNGLVNYFDASSPDQQFAAIADDAVEILPEYTLTISSTAGGFVTIPGEATFFYVAGTVVNLLAAPDPGYEFNIWTGNVGTIPDVYDPTTTITMSGNYSIIADFALIPPPPPTLCEAIDRGVDWLLDEQNSDGSWGSYYQVGQTSLALLKLETHATDRECGYGLPSPLDARYPYRGAVEDGLEFLMDNSYEIAIGAQPAGNPDTNGNSIGVCFYSNGNPGHVIYETGCALMALAASRAPNADTYGLIAQDTVDYLAWAQTDSGTGRGGWYYTPNTSWSDNSISGWAVLGLEYAESPAQGFECTVPAFVRSELNIWVDYIQCKTPGDDFGGSGYTSPCYWVNILKTGSLLQQFEFLGDDVNTPRVQDAIDYIERHWDDTNTDPGWRGSGPPANYQATYCAMKGLESFGIDRIDSIDWFDEIATVLIAQQNSDGSWPGGCNWGSEVLCTSWALLTLQKAVAKAPVPPPECDFRATPRSGFAPLTVRFTDLSTGEIDAWAWDFGDGGTSTQQNPSHRYTKDGKYTVTLEVTGPGGPCDVTKIAYIIVSVRVTPGAIVTAPADLASTNLHFSHEQVVPGQQLEISINIGNDGGTEGTRTVTLTINGYVEESQTVTVSPGSSKLVVFRVTKYEPGTYQVLVEGKEGVFYVLAPQKSNYFSGPLGTGGIIVIVVVAIVLIVAVLFVFRKRE